MLHKFHEHNFQNGYATHNAILNNVPYNPKVIFIGTYNHGWAWNQSDFFYGRDMYMWTILANLFLHNNNLLTLRRNANNNVPNFEQLFEICEKGKIVFADIIRSISGNIPFIEIPNDERVLVNDVYNWDDYKDKHLNTMGAQGWLDDNITEIIHYINATPTIKHVYFTFNSGPWLIAKRNEICMGINNHVESCSIFTPTGNGFGHNLLVPFNERAWSIAHQWIWNGLPNAIPVTKPGFGHLSHEWLIEAGVNPNNF